MAFLPYFYNEIIWLRIQAQIFPEHFHIFKHKHKSNIKGARFEFYKESLILGAAVEKCSEGKLSDRQLYINIVVSDKIYYHKTNGGIWCN